ncbi:MAG TPA: OsmC family protein [Thermoleophilia bacterium]|nr:OsmC family protein [Thermoleophilia bacterium]
MDEAPVDIRARQASLRQRYIDDPEGAPRTIAVRGGSWDLRDPLHASVTPVSTPGVELRAGAHPAVGGDDDAPCSADLLLASLAACQEITMRMVAANMGIALEDLEVTVEGDWDPRGTLAMGREFPVGLTAIRAHTRVVVAEDERGERAERLLRSAERYCVVLDTLRRGVPVDATLTLEDRA